MIILGGLGGDGSSRLTTMLKIYSTNQKPLKTVVNIFIYGKTAPMSILILRDDCHN